MNAYSRTAHDLASALLGQKRSEQTVHVSRSTFSGSSLGPRHVVLVVPEGQKLGTYYECGDRSLALLRAGMTPEDLELEPFDEDETEIDPFDGDYCHSDHFRQMMRGVR